MDSLLFTLLKFITLFQLIFFGFFLFFHSKGKRISNSILAVFLLSLAFVTFYRLFFHYMEICVENYPQVIFISESFGLLLGPALYFYFRSLSQRDFTFRKKDIVHLIPFVLFWCFIAPQIRIIFSDDQDFIHTSFNAFYENEDIVLNLVILVHFISYTTANVIFIRNYTGSLKDRFSDIDRMNLIWLNQLGIGFVITWLAGFLNYMFSLYGNQIVWLPPAYLTGVLFFSNVIVWKGLKQPELFGGLPDEEVMKPKYAKTLLPDEELNQYRAKLLRYMEDHKPYLKPDFSLQELADGIALPAHYVSQLLSTRLNQNFYQFINYYRIEECKRLLKEDSQSRKNVLGTCYEAGFNSKTTFNTVFKKYTGMTPTDFIKSQRN